MTKFFSNNIQPGLVYKLIHKLLKRLYISVRFQLEPEWKKRIISQVEKNREDTMRNIQESCERLGKPCYKDPIFRKLKRLQVQNNMASEVENKDTIITDDVLELVKLSGFKDYLRMYKREPSFAKHTIV